jgi:hypothetical protein
MILFLLPSWLRERMKQHRPVTELINTIVLMLVLFILLAIAYRVFEKQNWMESFWQSWQTQTTVGYGNAPAKTVAGRLATIVLGTAGIALLGVLFTRIFTLVEHFNTMRRYGMRRNPARGGYVLFNYPGQDQFVTFVEQIRLVEGNVGICLVDNRLEELPRSIEALGNIHFVRGSTLAQDTYERARVQTARCVIVFPVEAGKEESDASTRMVVDLVSEIAPEKTRIIYVLVDQHNSWLFRGARATAIPETLEMLALVQESQDKFTGPIIEEILLNSSGPRPHTVEPGGLVGMSWGEFCTLTTNFANRENLRVRPFALIEPGVSVDSCPEPSALIREQHLISVLAYSDSFDWVRLRKQLVDDKGQEAHSIF